MADKANNTEGMCKRVPANELGIEPSPETTALYQQIKNDNGTPRTKADSGAIRSHPAAVLAELLAAAPLFGASEALYEILGAQMDPADRQVRDQNLAVVRAQLTPAELSEVWAEGWARAKTLDLLKAEILSHDAAQVVSFMT